ncbi:hypothetical protein ABTL50_19720, partial [Acinetobacter baumannii]
WKSGFDQWLHVGAGQGLTYNGFTEQTAASAYLAAHADVAAAVAAGRWDSALDQFAAVGAGQGLRFAGTTAGQAPGQAPVQTAE